MNSKLTLQQLQNLGFTSLADFENKLFNAVLQELKFAIAKEKQ